MKKIYANAGKALEGVLFDGMLIAAGESEEAKRIAARALALAERGADAATLADAWFTHARVDWMLNRDQRIGDQVHRVRQKARECGATRTEALAASFLATLSLRAADVAGADSLYAASEALQLTIGNHRGAMIARQGRVRCLVVWRRFPEAIDMALAGVNEAQRLRFWINNSGASC